MKTLLVLRHAKSSWESLGVGDHDRPLNPRGKKDAPRIGSLIARGSIVPDLIISSTAKRAIHTAEKVAESSGYDAEIMKTRKLYHAAPEDYYEVLAEMAGNSNRVMVVGHNPGVEELIEELCGVSERMPTAALAHLSLNIQGWGEVGESNDGRLLNLWIPKELND